MPSIYQVPLLLEQQGLLNLLDDGLRIKDLHIPHIHKESGAVLLNRWKKLTTTDQEGAPAVNIALVGKYTSFHDSYISVIKALEHSAMRCGRQLQVVWVDSEDLEEGQDVEKYQKAWEDMREAHGILVPGGFGTRGTEGMIAAAKYARENDVPFLGICLGMQTAVIEYARNVLGVRTATSEEFDRNSGRNPTPPGLSSTLRGITSLVADFCAQSPDLPNGSTTRTSPTGPSPRPSRRKRTTTSSSSCRKGPRRPWGRRCGSGAAQHTSSRAPSGPRSGPCTAGG